MTNLSSDSTRVTCESDTGDIITVIGQNVILVTWEGLDDPDHNETYLVRVNGVWHDDCDVDQDGEVIELGTPMPTVTFE